MIHAAAAIVTVTVTAAEERVTFSKMRAYISVAVKFYTVHTVSGQMMCTHAWRRNISTVEK